MYERHKRRYSFCAKGERAVNVVLIKVGNLFGSQTKLLVLLVLQSVEWRVGIIVKYCKLIKDGKKSTHK